jgi:hypothetical protein
VDTVAGTEWPWILTTVFVAKDPVTSPASDVELEKAAFGLLSKRQNSSYWACDKSLLAFEVLSTIESILKNFLYHNHYLTRKANLSKKY